MTINVSYNINVQNEAEAQELLEDFRKQQQKTETFWKFKNKAYTAEIITVGMIDGAIIVDMAH